MGLDIKYTSDKWSYITRILGPASQMYLYIIKIDNNTRDSREGKNDNTLTK